MGKQRGFLLKCLVFRSSGGGQPGQVYNFHDNKRCGDNQLKMIRVQGYIVDHCVERRRVRDVERESAQTGG